VKENPILFSVPMARAILAGTKTQTRRVIKPQPIHTCDFFRRECLLCEKDVVANGVNSYSKSTVWHKPKYRRGDVLWVRETWRMQNYGYDPKVQAYEGQELQYRADFTDEEDACYGRRGGCAPCKWRPSIHMPRAAARIFLRVTDVRAEQIRDIRLNDILSEGIRLEWFGNSPPESHAVSLYLAFEKLWNDLNAKHGYGWAENPWVWAYTFERCDPPGQ